MQSVRIRLISHGPGESSGLHSTSATSAGGDSCSPHVGASECAAAFLAGTEAGCHVALRGPPPGFGVFPGGCADGLPGSDTVLSPLPYDVRQHTADCGLKTVAGSASDCVAGNGPPALQNLNWA